MCHFPGNDLWHQVSLDVVGRNGSSSERLRVLQEEEENPNSCVSMNWIK